MHLFTYTGPANRIWPDISAQPKPGETWDWSVIGEDRVPDELCWEPAEEGAKVTTRENQEEQSLARHTKAELVDLAAAEGLALDVAAKKDDLIAAIEAHRANPTATDADAPKE